MNKKLTPLEVSKQLKEFVLEFVNNGLDRIFINGSFDIIETALKRLEQHDKIFKKYDIDDNWLEPALYVIKNHFPMNTETQLKKLKALKIITEKNVQIKTLKTWSKTYKGKLTYQDYLGILEDCDLGDKLTEEEFELVIEVILCIN